MQRYEAYRDSGIEWIGEIPAGWEIRRLKQLCHMESGATPSKENLEYWDGDIPWVSSKEVKDPLIFDTSLHISEAGMDSCSTRLLPAGTLAIVVRSGILKHTIPVAKLMSPMTVNQDIKALEFNERHLSDWVQLFFQGMNDALLFALKKDGATVDSLDNGAFENCPIPVPPREEALLVSAWGSSKTAEIDSIVSQTERSIGLLREYRKSVISEAVTKGLDPDAPMKDSGVEWIGEIPAGWEVERLKYCISVNSGGIWGDDPLNDGFDKYVLRSTEQTVEGEWAITDPAIRNMSAVSKLETYRILPGDLVVTKSSGSPNHIGKTTIAGTEFLEREYYYSNFMQRVRLKDENNPRFYWYVMNSDLARNQYVFLQNSTSGLGNLSSETIGLISVPHPGVIEQQVIADYLDAKTAEVDSLIADKQRQVELLREYRKSLISEAVTGKFKVPGLE